MHPSRAPLAVRQERQKLLSFVIVGGGPTGVEVAAEMHDMIRVSQGLGLGTLAWRETCSAEAIASGF